MQTIKRIGWPVIQAVASLIASLLAISAICYKNDPMILRVIYIIVLIFFICCAIKSIKTLREKLKQ
ncbi:hypothetical protein [Fructilactobacillus carniphilus]|uniref:Uncharacterized protein n=1 Tax=Fructilactobacillus carniphilus TaxID=2940297 RepID=A0ABY5BWZ2_9LACO|nr:hypothetical protein [Fructilactobacillus carniphilus]USS90488.1 hypothetical protein M3M37_06520 [Fructilactobacillus carniphilus]